MYVTWWVSYKKKELLTIYENLGSPSILWWDPGSPFVLVFCVLFFFFFVCLRHVSYVTMLPVWLYLQFSLTFIFVRAS